MAHYRKKPVVVEAMQVEKPYKRVVEWCSGSRVYSTGNTVCGIRPYGLDRHGGALYADIGNWIVWESGVYLVMDHLYFKATYEAVDAE